MGNRRYKLSDLPSKIEGGQLLYVSHSVYEGEWQSISHVHFFSEIFFIIKGAGKIFIDDYIFNVKESNLVIIDPNVAHLEISQNDNPLEYIVLGVNNIGFINPNKSQNSYQSDYNRYDLQMQNKLEENTEDGYKLYDFSQYKSEIMNTLYQMISELENKNDNYVNMVYSMFQVLLIYIMRSVRCMPIKISEQRIAKEYNRVKRYIDSNYSKNITLDHLADVAHVNKYYLSHLFSKEFGVSPIKYLTERRIQVSKELLSSTDYSIAQISNSCGFSSQSYFSQSFKKFTDMTPAEYRGIYRN